MGGSDIGEFLVRVEGLDGESFFRKFGPDFDYLPGYPENMSVKRVGDGDYTTTFNGIKYRPMSHGFGFVRWVTQEEYDAVKERIDYDRRAA